MVIVSNGFQKFHMSALAAELQRVGRLAALLTGAYPTPFVRKFLRYSGLAHLRRIGRLFARAESMEVGRVRSYWLGEIVYQLALRIPMPTLRAQMMAMGMNAYSAGTVDSVRTMARNGARIFHYRSGFGGAAVIAAKRSGMLAVCDHSIIHPSYLARVIAGNGLFEAHSFDLELDPFWRRVVDDIDQADAVLVNSDFVRQSFLARGFDAGKVSTIYLGVDDQFFERIPERPMQTRESPLVFLFAAALCDARKGVNVLLRAFREMGDVPWELKIAGTIPADVMTEFADVLRSPKTTLLGILSRSELATEMVNADVFIFPSLAEGSARVVFEALACGCFVITTPNSGSIVEDRVHGRLVPAGDDAGLKEAVRETIIGRAELPEIGRRNAVLVGKQFRQKNYGENILAYHGRLLANPGSRPDVEMI